MSFYRVEGPNQWGDYGHILIHGMTAHLPRKDNRLQLERTGPFMPPITLPGVGDVLVTDVFRSELTESPFAHLDFCGVVKARIVEYHWENWDRKSPEPEEYPESGEPETMFCHGRTRLELPKHWGAFGKLYCLKERLWTRTPVVRSGTTMCECTLRLGTAIICSGGASEVKIPAVGSSSQKPEKAGSNSGPESGSVSKLVWKSERRARPIHGHG